MVKNELNSEEQFFEKAVQTERFVKKYKKPLIGLITAAVLAIGTGSAYDIYTQNKIDQSNAAFNVLMADPDDQTAQEQLKTLNPKLFDVWSLSKAMKSKDKEALRTLQSSDALAVADLASYELAAIEEDTDGLQNYAQKSGALLKDLALIDAAVLLLEKGDVTSAKEKLSMIDINSPLYESAQSLAHYGVK
ncbi:hypothetical protein [Sulfurimonas sp. HSL3-7]|uniref:hypothetical protein n=1 Tax=Sulfonitrofixus jiaomeiensis TaxID=3131938 RepID=UPI0031F85522